MNPAPPVIKIRFMNKDYLKVILEPRHGGVVVPSISLFLPFDLLFKDFVLFLKCQRVVMGRGK